MLAVLPMIATALATALSFLVKNPFVNKMLIFAFFVAIIKTAISFFVTFVTPYLVNNPLFAVASYFGALDGLSIYITIIVAGFGVKQVLAFIRS